MSKEYSPVTIFRRPLDFIITVTVSAVVMVGLPLAALMFMTQSW